MAIRLTGMVSNMDTDSMVQELVKAYSTKKDTLVKEQTKLSWKQDAWKSLNTKIYSFYSKSLNNMRFSQNYNTKKTTVSDTTKASVIAGEGAVSGTQSLAIRQLATAGYLTGGKLESTASGSTPKASTTLADMGVTENSTMTVTTGGKDYTINLNTTSTLSDIATQISNTGLGASYDATNQRFFVNATKTGADSDFSISGDSDTAVKTLSKLGLFSSTDTASNATYAEWASYGGSEKDGTYTLYDNDTIVANLVDKIATETASLQKTYQSTMDAATKIIDTNQSYLDDGATTEASNNELYQDAKSKLSTLSDEELSEQYGVSADSADETKIATILAKELENAKADGSGKTEEEVTALTNASALATNISNATININNAQSAYNTASDNYDAAQTTATTKLVAKAKSAVAAMNGDYDSYGSSSAVRIVGQDAKIFLNGASFTSSTNTFSINGLTITAQETTGLTADATDDEEDASNYNTVTLATDTDVDSIYDSIKSFLSEYNTLITEMDKLYNASSAKGYEPLTDDEKDAMSDTEIEDWETKIKDALLRRDDTLDGVINSMKNSMAATYTGSDGTTYSLSSFGINTLSYFLSSDNEKGVYHIDGDSDDSSTASATDKLKTMIASNPEAVQGFFTSLTQGVYSALSDKMKSTTMSSAYTVYDDKQMASDYSDYTTKISDWETKLQNLEDKYYSQFSKMETALSQLNSSQSALSSLLSS